MRINSADLSFRYDYANFLPTHFNIDLWGVGFQNSTTPIQRVFNQDTGDPGNTKIQDNIITYATTVPSTISTNSAGEAVLTSYIQGFYDAHPSYSGDNYVFLRLNQDSPNGGSAELQMLDMREAGGSYVPILTLNVVPEPSTFALLGAGAVGLIGYTWGRRRRAKA
jgi:hypothetical protein